jgi:hypothetical protein
MPKDKNLGYFEWLKAQGVENTFENTYGHNKTQAKNVYSFASQKEAINFKNKYLADGSSFGEVFFDQRLNKYVMPINLQAQESLKNQFQNERPVPLTLEDCQRQMDLVEQATEKVQKFNTSEVTPGLKITRANYGKVGDRIGNVAKMLSNQHDAPGWYQHASISAIDLMLTVYSATNDQLLSPQERETINHTGQSILKTNSKGKFVGGLKADANFDSYIKEQYDGDTNKAARINLIRENTEQLLNGGQRVIIDKDTPHKLKTLAAKIGAPNSYTQPRFLPDQNGRSDTDELIIHAGGMAGHSATRVLKKEKDKSAPGGYRYFYTKIDAGGGLERVDHSTKTGTGIYTTEVTPYFKTRELPNGKLAVRYDSNGNPQKMNQKEIEALNSNPKEYQRHMEANLFALISAEREIEFYKNSGQLTVAHGEPTAVKDGKFDEWQFFNNKIRGSRGVEVPERTKITPIQLTGNCTAYSAMLTAIHLAGDVIGYDLMQSAKTYNQADVIERLNQRKASIEQDKQNIKALAEVQSIFSLKPEQVVYQTNKTGKISFTDIHEIEKFKESLSKTYNINVNSSKRKDGTSYNIELNPQQIGQIVSHAKGFKDVSLIQNLPESQNCEIIKILDSQKQQNYIVQFADQAEAQRFSKALNERYQIKGGNGGSKFVSNHITGDGRYGVIITEDNLNSLIPQLRQEEATKRRDSLNPPKVAQKPEFVPGVGIPKKADKAPGYDIVMSERTLQNINIYKESLISGQEQPGKFLQEKLEEAGKSVADLNEAEFIEVILSTKKPKFFAESAIQGGGRDWNNRELEILGDINVTVPVKVYDNGIWDPADPNFAAHANPLDGELLFTPGALLKSGAQFSGQTPDLAEVTKNGKIDQKAYNALVERRLLPLLVHANEKAGLEGKPALITLPGVGAGEFAGKFKGEMGQHLNIAIQAMLEKHSGNLGNIAAIHYDSFAECTNEQRNYGNIKYRVRPQLKGNQGKTQLSDPTAYQEPGDDFSKCKLYKVVAWDHVSLPGNDFFIGRRHTDDGVAAAATNSMEGITGVTGHYDKATGKYLPPKAYNTWEEVANKQGVHLKVQNNIKIVTDKGVSVKLADYQRVVIPKPPANLGYSDITIIGKTKPAGLSEVMYIKDNFGQNNYLLNFVNKQDAINYSASLAKYDVRGSQGNKYVNTLQNGQYQIVLTDANIVTLQQNKSLNPPPPVHKPVLSPTTPPPPPPHDRSQESHTVKDKQLSEQYVKKELVPMVDKFVSSHTNGKAVTEPEIRKFYTDVLSKLQTDGYISGDNVKSFTKPLNGSTTSQLDQAIKDTAQTINDQDILPIKLGIGEKLMFSLSKVATILNIPRMREFFLNRITPENLGKMTRRENILAQSIDIITSLQGSHKTTGPKAARVVAARGDNRTGRAL